MERFSARLKAARKMQGWSLNDLSEKIGKLVTKQSLSLYETGEARPGSDVLVAICRALEVSSDFFVREEIVKIEKMSFRKLKKLSATEQDRVVANAQDFVNRYLELENILNIKSSVKIRRIPISDYNDVEKAAESIRKDWKSGSDPLSSVVELLEDHSYKVFEMTADISFSGMSAWVNESIPVIVLNSSTEIPSDRKRFTALHELGHLVLDLDKFSEKEQEHLCNRFAAAMLIPRDIIIKEIGKNRARIFILELGQLKLQYGISIQALIYRLHQLDIITNSYFKHLMLHFSRLGYRTNEPVSYEATEKSNRFLQLLLRGVAEEIISTSKGASLNNQRLADFRKLLA
jgi:Zn-dependent peptidase ImmA (M78 family)/DNA-binding XRE family transcriptional regulator